MTSGRRFRAKQACASPLEMEKHEMSGAKLDELCVTTIRMLAVDMVQAAKSGHPGMPLGASPGAYVIWDRFLRHNPANPKWFNRDRFVLSAGHSCTMLYSLLHLTGYDLPLDELKRFRQVGSKCPGHPEAHMTPGVEATTGPLGQGIANAVGMAIAEAHLAAVYNQPGHEIISHNTFVLCSEGDMMEGVSGEAASVAGFLKLGKLIALYDDNGISIEGSTRNLAFNEDVGLRFEAYGWQVLKVADMNDLAALEKAIRDGLAEENKPTLIWCKSTIGFGSPEANTAKVHGEPFKDEAAAATKAFYKWDKNPAFFIPPDALAHFRQALDRGKKAEEEWNHKFDEYRKAHPDLAARLSRAIKGEFPAGWEKSVPVFKAGDDMATRDASGKVMNAVAPALEGYLVGGSADLAPSNKTYLAGLGDMGPGKFAGINMHFGVREHAMGSICNGMALHGGMRPFGATFLVFADYVRPPIRVAAITHLPVIYVFTHDSIGVGEDGPTHQPVEHLASLRAIPNLVVLRPADANETAAAWKVALTRTNGPTALALTRQKLPTLDLAKYPVEQGVPRGAYVISEAAGGKPQVVLIGTGSELELVMKAQEALAAEGVCARVVSMPSWELFEAQDASYRAEVLPDGMPRVAVETGARIGWDRYITCDGDGIFQETFGCSGAYKDVFKKSGFTVENIVARTKALLQV